MTITPVAVIGAGTIGRGVAHSLAATGHEVLLVDVGEEILADAMVQIAREMRFARFLGQQRGEDDGAALARIATTVDYGRLARARFVVENVTENWDIKREVYRRAGRGLRSGRGVRRQHLLRSRSPGSPGRSSGPSG